MCIFLDFVDKPVEYVGPGVPATLRHEHLMIEQLGARFPFSSTLIGDPLVPVDGRHREHSR
jgi:hypothetical protein